MKLLFLGPGAADWPTETAHLGDERGLDRRYTSVLVDDDILIDPGPDVPEALQTFGADPKKITAVLISHSHGDHFSADTLSWLADLHPIDVYGSDGYAHKLPRHPGLTFHTLAPRESREVASGTLKALTSTHLVGDTDETCLHYVLQRGGNTLLYATDGAWFTERTFSDMGKFTYDCIILDATFGDDTSRYRIPDRWILFAHNGLSMVRHICESFRDKRKCVHEGTVFVADHLARHYYPDIETARAAFEPFGAIAAYDGMRLTLQAPSAGDERE